MSASKYIADLVAPLTAVQQLLARFNDRGIVIGGIAVSLLGKPRLTADIDAVILLSVDDLPDLVRAAAHEGFEPRITGAEEFARALEMPELWDDIARMFF